jgi:hypothetical protein
MKLAEETAARAVAIKDYSKQYAVYQALSTVNRTLGRTEKAHHYQIQAYEIAKLHKLSDMVFFSLYVFLKTFQPNENIGRDCNISRNLCRSVVLALYSHMNI